MREGGNACTSLASSISPCCLGMECIGVTALLLANLAVDPAARVFANSAVDGHIRLRDGVVAAGGAAPSIADLNQGRPGSFLEAPACLQWIQKIVQPAIRYSMHANQRKDVFNHSV